MHEMILCKLGEVVLKGLNRRSFEMKLMGNIRRRTGRFGKFRVYSKQSTIYVEPAEETCDLSGAYAACKQVFGIIARGPGPALRQGEGGHSGNRQGLSGRCPDGGPQLQGGEQAGG